MIKFPPITPFAIAAKRHIDVLAPRIARARTKDTFIERIGCSRIVGEKGVVL